MIECEQFDPIFLDPDLERQLAAKVAVDLISDRSRGFDPDFFCLKGGEIGQMNVSTERDPQSIPKPTDSTASTKAGDVQDAIGRLSRRDKRQAAGVQREIRDKNPGRNPML